MPHVTNTTTNTAATATYLNKTFYDRNLLEMAKTKFVFANYGQKKRVPKNSGKTVEFRRWNHFTDDISSGLTEGVTPYGQALSQGNVTATMKGYGAFVEVSDMLKTTAYDDVVMGATELLGEQVGCALEKVIVTELNNCTNVQIAGGRAAASALTATDIITIAEVRKAVRTLKNNKAPMFSGNGRSPHYICICSPSAVFDLQSDVLWQNVSSYSHAEAIYSGEIGRMFGVVFVESTEIIGGNAGANSAIPYQVAYIFGKDAYGTVSIDGGNIETIIKGLGSAGSADPLDQRATVGAKVNNFAAKILNDAWMVKLTHAYTS